MKFADRLQKSIERAKSVLVAGFDPVLETFPKCILDDAASKGAASEDAVYHALVTFYEIALDSMHDNIAAIKPNIAFFEQYGIGGFRALSTVCAMVRERKLPLILDAKRGDISSTAEAYSRATLGRTPMFGIQTPILDADAVTVNPFLGFDTLQPFIKTAKDFEKGLFILVRTSNPGHADLQRLRAATGKDVSESVADFIAHNAQELMGECGYSGLGAVVGASHPEDAQHLRALMPKNLFLVPGMGAQGATARDAVSGFDKSRGGAVINVSRALMSDFSSLKISRKQISEELAKKSEQLKEEICRELKRKS